jgi:gluconolactonase
MTAAVEPPAIVAEAPAFADLFAPQAAPRLLAGGHAWLEGPVWLPSGEFICSDIPHDTIYRFDGARLVPWRKGSGHANGNTLDRQGRLITCQHALHAVQRTEPDGSTTQLVATYQGKPLNSPNDVVVSSDGAIWFTDPPYGLDGRAQEQAACRVYRLDPDSRDLTAVCEDCVNPNGLCFSPDEKRLYVADSAAVRVMRYEVVDGRRLAGGAVFAVTGPGVPDGIRCDGAGRLWVCLGDGVHVYGPDGSVLGRILLHRVVANCCFGGPEGRTLYMTAASELWSVELAGPRHYSHDHK